METKAGSQPSLVRRDDLGSLEKRTKPAERDKGVSRNGIASTCRIETISPSVVCSPVIEASVPPSPGAAPLRNANRSEKEPKASGRVDPRVSRKSRGATREGSRPAKTDALPAMSHHGERKHRHHEEIAGQREKPVNSRREAKESHGSKGAEADERTDSQPTDAEVVTTRTCAPSTSEPPHLRQSVDLPAVSHLRDVKQTLAKTAPEIAVSQLHPLRSPTDSSQVSSPLLNPGEGASCKSPAGDKRNKNEHPSSGRPVLNAITSDNQPTGDMLKVGPSQGQRWPYTGEEESTVSSLAPSTAGLDAQAVQPAVVPVVRGIGHTGVPLRPSQRSLGGVGADRFLVSMRRSFEGPTTDAACTTISGSVDSTHRYGIDRCETPSLPSLMPSLSDSPVHRTMSEAYAAAALDSLSDSLDLGAQWKVPALLPSELSQHLESSASPGGGGRTEESTPTGRGNRAASSRLRWGTRAARGSNQDSCAPSETLTLSTCSVTPPAGPLNSEAFCHIQRPPPEPPNARTLPTMSMPETSYSSLGSKTASVCTPIIRYGDTSAAVSCAVERAKRRVAHARRKANFSCGDGQDYVFTKDPAFDLPIDATLAFHASAVASWKGSPALFVYGGQLASKDAPVRFGDCEDGCISNVLALFEFHSNEWSYHEMTSMEPLAGHTMTALEDRLLVCGGMGPQATGLFNSLWVVDIATMTPYNAASNGKQPPGRARHAAAILESNFYIFGGHCHRGRSFTTLFNDLHSFDLASCTWQEVGRCGSPPPQRFGHAMTSWGGKLWIYGGTDGQTSFNDLWQNIPEREEWTEVKLHGKSDIGRFGAPSVLTNDDRWIIFGGETTDKSQFPKEINDVRSAPLADLLEIDLCLRNARRLRPASASSGVRPQLMAPSAWAQLDLVPTGFPDVAVGRVHNNGLLLLVTGGIGIGDDHPSTALISEVHHTTSPDRSDSAAYPVARPQLRGLSGSRAGRDSLDGARRRMQTQTVPNLSYHFQGERHQPSLTGAWNSSDPTGGSDVPEIRTASTFGTIQDARKQDDLHLSSSFLTGENGDTYTGDRYDRVVEIADLDCESCNRLLKTVRSLRMQNTYLVEKLKDAKWNILTLRGLTREAAALKKRNEEIDQELERLHRVQRHPVLGSVMKSVMQVSETTWKGRACLRCHKRQRKTAFISCGHVSACEECAAGFLEGHPSERYCPICNAWIDTFITIQMDDQLFSNNSF